MRNLRIIDNGSGLVVERNEGYRVWVKDGDLIVQREGGSPSGQQAAVEGKPLYDIGDPNGVMSALGRNRPGERGQNGLVAAYGRGLFDPVTRRVDRGFQAMLMLKKVSRGSGARSARGWSQEERGRCLDALQGTIRLLDDESEGPIDGREITRLLQPVLTELRALYHDKEVRELFDETRKKAFIAVGILYENGAYAPGFKSRTALDLEGDYATC